MKKNLFFAALLFAVCFASCEKDDGFNLSDTHVLNLDSHLPKADSTWIGDTSGTETNGTYFNQFGDGFFLFDNYYTPQWNSWGGFAMTNAQDTETGDYTNNSAIAGKAVFSDAYVTAFHSAYNPSVISFADGGAHKMIGMYVTNSTYAYRVIENGNDYARKFATDDWFKLDIFGKTLANEHTDTVSVYLADFREGKSHILGDWKYITLKDWEEVKSIHFHLSSTDNGDYGMNTPAYFCLSGISAMK